MAMRINSQLYYRKMNLSPNFSKKPGCWEQQLIRRSNNPLFPESARTVVQHQVVEARERDGEEQQQFKKQFQSLVHKVSTLPDKAEAEQLLTLTDQLDHCYTQCMNLCTPQPQEQKALTQLITLFENTLLKHADEESAFLQQVQQASSERKLLHKALQSPIVAAMMREESPISSEDLPATLLSATTEEGETLLPILEAVQLQQLQQQMEEILQRVEGADEPVSESALEIMQKIREAH